MVQEKFNTLYTFNEGYREQNVKNIWGKSKKPFNLLRFLKTLNIIKIILQRGKKINEKTTFCPNRESVARSHRFILLFFFLKDETNIFTYLKLQEHKHDNVDTLLKYFLHRVT